jgi:anti-anti-sigma factor
MPHLANSWRFRLDRGPNWLFVRLQPDGGSGCDETELAERVAELMDQHFTDRLVLEMHDVDLPTSLLLGQIVKLHKQVHARGGLMRMCGATPHTRDVLAISRLDTRIPLFADRFEAVRGGLPHKPR